MKKQELENLRESIRQEAETVRKKAYESGLCAVCESSIPSQRRSRGSYTCSQVHAFQFFAEHDYSQNSPILREKKRELREQQPKKERNPWTKQKAAKEYLCTFCSLSIQAGEEYDKYTRLPSLDEFFEDSPYESLPYHVSCMEFYSAVFQSAGFDEGLDDKEITLLFRAVSQMEGIGVSETREKARKGELGHLYTNGTEIAGLMDEIEKQDTLEFGESLGRP